MTIKQKTLPAVTNVNAAADAGIDARSRIEAQLASIRNYFHFEKRADQATLNDDMLTMPHFAALSNQRCADLNLSIAESPSALLRQIKTMPPAFHLRCVLRSTENSKGGAHHLYADIRREADSPLSILLVEPADFKYNQNGRSMVLALLILMLPDPFFAGRRISCFNAAAQKSGSDCLIFCLDFALKAQRHATHFLQLHAIHRDGSAIGNDEGNPVIDQNNCDALSLAPARLLPFDFFEHAQSRSALREIFGEDDPRVIEQIRKMDAQRGPSIPAPAKFMPSSIERCRRRFLLDTLAALNAPQQQQR